MDRQKRFAAIIIVLVLLAGSLSFYAAEAIASSHPPAQIKTPTGIKVSDSLNRTFVFPEPVKRIVSIDPSATATLYALGAYRDVVGGNSFDSYPPNSTVPSVGNSYGIDYEEVVNLSAQVVLFYGATLSKDALYINNTLHIPVLLDNPSNFSQIESFTTMLGVLTGTQKNASLINNWMNESVSGISNATSSISSDASVFYYLSNYGGYWTAGNDTFINQIFQIAHVRNIATSTGYYSMSGEEIANDSPQIIFLDQYVNYSAVTVEPFDSTPAFMNNRIYAVFNDNFFDQPDFRIVYALYWTVNEVYPSLFVHLPAFPLSLEYPPSYGF